MAGVNAVKGSVNVRQHTATAVASLAVNHNAHIVLCDPEKRPYWDGRTYGWKRRRPSTEVIEAHPGPFGIVPWSVRTTGLDVDHGDPLQLSLLADPIANLQTRRGHHLYCSDTAPRQNARFKVAGCSGEVRGANGYLVLHFDGAERLLDAIRRRDDWHPRDLFELAGITTRAAAPPPSRDRTSAATPVEAVALQNAREGCRWESLRAYLHPLVRVEDRPRRWPGGPVDVQAFVARVEALTAAALDAMPTPRLPWSEAGWLAYALATWFGSHAGRADGSSTSQAWRGRRNKGQGREASLFDDMSNEAARPWDAEGVSRRTWYRRRAGAKTAGETLGRKWH